ncbi:MAG: hypothetical protein UX17_C0034G0002 [Parcubacteria group bacterium GW2011_GWC2_45_7]|nr:MAG: hypothetical protein UX17_C0034G0002 [Parcubacteria group bacterium GW2011_GWC2_45_7]
MDGVSIIDRMKSIHYGRQSINGQDINAVVKTLRSDFLTQGPLVEKFEKKLAAYCGVKYAVAVSSGTAALHAAMFAVGIGPGDEVIVPPLSFVATANCVLYLGATPVFADVVYETGLLDPQEVEKKITKKTKAIITVDYSGHPSYFRELRAIAKKHKLVLVDDASHSLGATYRGERIGAQADITTFSFHPVKIITTGEGGMVVTTNKKFYERANRFRTHGITKNPDEFISKHDRLLPWYYEMQDLGFNYRLTDIQCALGISQLQRIDSFLAKRRKIGLAYTMLFGNDRHFKPYKEQMSCQSSWHFYPLRINGISAEKKFQLFRQLNAAGIFPQVHYIPIYLQPYYRKRFGYRQGDFPKAERFYKEEISLPLFVNLPLSDVKRIVDTLKRIVR